MHRVPAIGESLVLVQLRSQAVIGTWRTLPTALAGEKRREECPDREWGPVCGAVFEVERAKLPWGLLHPRSCEHSPLARPEELPLRVQRVPVPPRDTSGRLGLARAASQSHVPNAGPLSLSVTWAPIAVG